MKIKKAWNNRKREFPCLALCPIWDSQNVCPVVDLKPPPSFLRSSGSSAPISFLPQWLFCVLGNLALTFKSHCRVWKGCSPPLRNAHYFFKYSLETVLVKIIGTRNKEEKVLKASREMPGPSVPHFLSQPEAWIQQLCRLFLFLGSTKSCIFQDGPWDKLQLPPGQHLSGPLLLRKEPLMRGLKSDHVLI